MASKASRQRTLRILSAVAKEIRKAVRPVIEREAGEIVAMQKRLVAKDSGALRDSIRVEMGDTSVDSTANLAGGSAADGSGGDPDLTATIIAGNQEAYYARFVEFETAPHINGGMFAGTENPGTRAQPFFYGPFRARKKKAKAAVSRAIGKAVRAAATKS